jgi:carbon storage regulator
VLVLTRHANQSIMIGHDIVVTVLEVRGDQVRLGIKAPQHVEVHREEVFAALQEANRQAASPSAAALDSLDELQVAPQGAEAAAAIKPAAPPAGRRRDGAA